nr:hypothetical protein [Clostridiales bacterium]
YHYYIVSNTGSILEVSDTYFVAVKAAETEGGTPTIKLLKVTEGDQLNIEKKESAGYRLTVNNQAIDYLWTAEIVAAGETTVSRQVEQSGGGSVLTYYTGGTLFTSSNNLQQIYFQDYQSASKPGVYAISTRESETDSWEAWTFTDLDRIGLKGYVDSVEMVRIYNVEPVYSLQDANGNAVLINSNDEGVGAYLPTEPVMSFGNETYYRYYMQNSDGTLGSEVSDYYVVKTDVEQENEDHEIEVVGTFKIVRLADEITDSGRYLLSQHAIALPGIWSGGQDSITILRSTDDGEEEETVTGGYLFRSENGLMEYYYLKATATENGLFADRMRASVEEAFGEWDYTYFALLEDPFAVSSLVDVMTGVKVTQSEETESTRRVVPMKIEQDNTVYYVYATADAYDKVMHGSKKIWEGLVQRLPYIYLMSKEAAESTQTMTKSQVYYLKPGAETDKTNHIYDVLIKEKPNTTLIKDGVVSEEILEYILTDDMEAHFADGAVGLFNFNEKESYVIVSEEESGHTQLVLRFGSPETPVNMTITGPVSGIELQPTVLPDNGLTVDADKDCYQLTDILYLTKSGLIVNINGLFASKFDGDVYTSTNVIATNLKAPEVSGIPADVSPTVMIRKDQPIRPQLMTDHIAVDLNGDYWYFAEDMETGRLDWDKIGSEASTSNVTVTTKKTEITLDGTNTVTVGAGETTVKYGGRIYLQTMHGIDENGVNVLYYIMPVFTGSNLNGYIKAGSDGTIDSISAKATQKVLEDQSGTNFETETISAGEDVTIRLEDENGSILDGDTPHGKPDDNDIHAGGTITIIADSEGSIGTVDDPVEVQGETLIEDDDGSDDGNNVISTDTFFFVDKGDMIIDKNVIVDHAEWEIGTHDGSIIFADPDHLEEPQYTLTVINGGTAFIQTNKNLDEHGNYSPNTEAENPGNILIKELTIEGRGTFEIEEEGSVTEKEVISNAFFDAGSAADGTGGNILIGAVTVGTDNAVDTAGGAPLIGPGLPEGEWTAVAGGSITIGTGGQSKKCRMVKAESLCMKFHTW